MKKSGENKLRYDRLVMEADIPLLDNAVQRQISRAIEKKLATFPEVYGEPLRGKLSGYWKLRVGDWRVVYSIGDNEVFILGIRHRSRIYEVMEIGTECACPECAGTGIQTINERQYDCQDCEKGQAFAQYGKDWGEILAKLIE